MKRIYTGMDIYGDIKSYADENNYTDDSIVKKSHIDTNINNVLNNIGALVGSKGNIESSTQQYVNTTETQMVFNVGVQSLNTTVFEFDGINNKITFKKEGTYIFTSTLNVTNYTNNNVTVDFILRNSTTNNVLTTQSLNPPLTLGESGIYTLVTEVVITDANLPETIEIIHIADFSGISIDSFSSVLETMFEIPKRTSSELASEPITNNKLYWHIEQQRYIVGDVTNDKWKYIQLSTDVFIPPADPGVWIEDWSGTLDDIKTRWISSGFASTLGSNENGLWSFDNNKTSSSQTGPSAAHSAVYYIYTEASSNGYLTDFTLETSNFAELTEIDFYYHAYGSDIGHVSLEYKVGGIRTEIWGVDGDQGNSWNNHVADFTGLGATAIRFRHFGASSYRADVAFDSIQITSV